LDSDDELEALAKQTMAQAKALQDAVKRKREKKRSKRESRTKSRSKDSPARKRLKAEQKPIVVPSGSVGKTIDLTID